MKLAVIAIMGAFLYVVYSVFLLENPELYVIGCVKCDAEVICYFTPRDRDSIS